MATVTLKKQASRLAADDILPEELAENGLTSVFESRGTAKDLSGFLQEFPACIIGLSHKLEIKFWNTRCEQILGYTSAEMCNQKKQLYLPCPDWEKSQSILHTWRRLCFCFADYEVEFKSKSGELKYLNFTSLPQSELLPQHIHFIVGVDVTAQHKAEQNLQTAARHLVIEREALREKNQTLQELLGQINDEKERLAVFLRSNIEAFVLPMFERLKTRADKSESEYIGLIESSLKAVIGEIGLSHKEFFNSLTPREIEICQMVKGGFSSKEIGTFINCSEATVRQHRRNIRKKLGIKRKRVNLVTYLQAGGMIDDKVKQKKQ